MTQAISYLIIGVISLVGLKPGMKSEKEWFRKTNTDQIRGMCALLIIIHHISAQNFSGGMFHQLGYISIISGYLLVGYFFLISGYGLEYGEIHLSNNKNHRLIKRIITINIPYITISSFYVIYQRCVEKPIGFFEIGRSLILGDPIVKYSWYSATIIIVYVLFEISKKNHKKRCKIYIMAVLLCVYIGVGIHFNYSEYWYNTVMIVIVGILAARYKASFFRYFSCHYKLKFSICVLALFSGIILQIKYGNYLASINPMISVLIQQGTLLAFVLSMMNFDLAVELNSTALKWISTFSYEIYLTHGLAMIIIKNCTSYDTAGVLYAMAVIFLTIVLSFIEHFVNKWMICVLTKYFLA